MIRSTYHISYIVKALRRSLSQSLTEAKNMCLLGEWVAGAMSEVIEAVQDSEDRISF